MPLYASPGILTKPGLFPLPAPLTTSYPPCPLSLHLLQAASLGFPGTVCVQMDDSKVVSGDGGAVRLWSHATGRRIATLQVRRRRAGREGDLFQAWLVGAGSGWEAWRSSWTRMSYACSCSRAAHPSFRLAIPAPIHSCLRLCLQGHPGRVTAVAFDDQLLVRGGSAAAAVEAGSCDECGIRVRHLRNGHDMATCLLLA